MTPTDPTRDPLHQYCRTLYATLRRYRRTTILGWMVVAAGCAGIGMSWELDRFHTMLGVVMSAGTILAGVLLVDQSVGFLSAVVAIPPGEVSEEADASAGLSLSEEVRTLREDIDRGGWQEAFAGLRRLRSLADRAGFSLEL